MQSPEDQLAHTQKDRVETQEAMVDAGGRVILPPDLPWYLVLILTAVNPIFYWAWLLCDARFVKKLDPNSKAISSLMVAGAAIALGLAVTFFIGSFFAATGGSKEDGIFWATIASACFWLVAVAFEVIAAFDLRISLQKHYRSMHIDLSPFMTFFFGAIYFQYRFDQRLSRTSSDFGTR